MYKHLSEEERYQIQDLKIEGFSNRKVAELMGRAPSSIYRELKRNRGERGWRPRQAQKKAAQSLSERGRRNVRRVSESAWEYAEKHLTKEQWSPEQIAGRLALEKSDRISHETIYQRILKDKKAGGTLFTHLRCKKKRKKRYGSNRKNRDTIPNRVDISQRPAIVDSRRRIGDWEGDTIIGSHTKGVVIGSMVERKSRFTVLCKARNKTTVEVISSISEQMRPLADLVSTITLDNGKEFTYHGALGLDLNAQVYFARPYHSWERGLNENTNGLVRQYCPKSKSFEGLTDKQLQEVARKLNNRPRKCLGFKTPLEVLRQSCQRHGIILRV